MSRMTPHGKILTDLYNRETNKISYQYKKISNTHKFNGISSNASLTPNNILNNNKYQPENYAQNIFNEKENHTNNKPNISINASTIINPGNNNDNETFQKYITINDIIGEKCELNLDILKLFFENYDQSKTSKKSMGSIKSYGVNTYQGIVRNYNEDRVSIIINMNKPKNFLKKWPKISFFGIYDGHGGEGCSEFLRDNLHKYICENNYFPDNIPEAIKYGIQKAEYEFLNNYALSTNKEEIIDKSGSCVIILLIVETNIYIANVGDSRCLLSMDNGKNYIMVTKDHKPNSPNEIIRIKNNGGNVYQSQTVINNLENAFLNGKILIGPYRVIPGRLSVCRTIGDAEAKIKKFGGNPNVIISTPDIFYYDLKKENLDFFILGCDGIYDQMSNKEILDLAWMILKNNNNKSNFEIKENGLNGYNENNSIDINNIHYKSGLIVDLILKASLARKSFDNVTCLFIGLKDFIQDKPNGIDIIKNNNNNELNNNINININSNTNNINGKINPTFSGIAMPKKNNNENINSNGGIINNINKLNNIPDKNKINSSEKIYTIKKKSKILNKKNFYKLTGEEARSKTNRNENRKNLLDNNMDSNNKLNRIFNTDSKINSMNFHPYNDERLSEDKNITEIRTDIKNGSEKNNLNIFRKIHKKPNLTKDNNENKYSKETHKLLNKRANQNLMTYSKKNQSYNKINKYLNDKTNTYKHIKKNNIDIDIYNTYTSKKLSEPNTNRFNNNTNINMNINKNNNFHIFKPISKLHKSNQPFKIIEPKNTFANSSKNINFENKNALNKNNMNNISMKNPRFLNKVKDNSNNNSTYLSFTSNLSNFDNNNNINNKFRYNNIMENSSNNKMIETFLIKNNGLKKPKKYFSLNNTQNLTFESNHAFSISNNLMINRYINNAFTTKMKRDLTSKLRQISTNKSFQTNKIINNNPKTTNHNTSMQSIQKPNYIYNYSDKNNKIGMYNYNYKSNIDSKSYRSFTYNSNKNKNQTKYNNYLITDLGKAKNQFFFDDIKKDIY